MTKSSTKQNYNKINMLPPKPCVICGKEMIPSVYYHQAKWDTMKTCSYKCRVIRDPSAKKVIDTRDVYVLGGKNSFYREQLKSWYKREAEINNKYKV